jgi:nucleoside-diphosphate-sugar epimerase
VLIPLLLRQGFKVTVYDSLLYGGTSLLPYVSNPNFSFIKGDVRDKKTLSYALNNNDLIIHLAAIVGLSACNRDPKLAHSTNVEGTKNIIDLLSPSQILIFASTVSNYGAALGNSCKEDIALNIKERIDYYLHFADIGEDKDKRNYCISYEKINALGFKATKTVDEGIDEFIKSCQLFEYKHPYKNY